MILALVKISPVNEYRQDVLDILFTVKEPILASPGCLSCCIYESCGENSEILYLEKWKSMVDFEPHIRSKNYARILQAMELSSQAPEISYYETAESWNLDLIEQVRDSEFQIAATTLQSHRFPVH